MTDRVLMPRDDDGHVIESGEMWEAFQQAGADLLAMAPSPERDKAEVAFVRACGDVGLWETWIEIMTGGEFDSDDFSPFHRKFWAWVVSIGDERPRPYVACWPRGAGKTSSLELAVMYWACNETRAYCMYVGMNQKNVEDKVENIGIRLMSEPVQRFYPKAATRFTTDTGTERDWTKKRIRTETIAVDAFGLDVAMRGVKLKDDRPGIILWDDIEAHSDTPHMTQKRIDILTKAIIPAGSTNPIYAFVQNKIHDDSIMARMLDGRADFLNDRIVSGPIPQIYDMELEEETVTQDGIDRRFWQIVGGEPSWPQVLTIDVSNEQLRDEGLLAFQSEKQHDTTVEEGDMFPKAGWAYSDTHPNNGMTLVRSWDLASTEDAGDWTVGVLMGRHDKTGQYYVLDVIRGQWLGSTVEDKVVEAAAADTANYPGLRYEVVIESQPAAAGKVWNERWKKDLLDGYAVHLSPTGSGNKPFRADGYSSTTQSGGVTLLNGGDWGGGFVREHAQFPNHGRHDDQVDAAAQGFNRLSNRKRRKARVSTVAGASY